MTLEEATRDKPRQQAVGRGLPPTTTPRLYHSLMAKTPVNLTSLHSHEEDVRQQSIAAINLDSEMSGHLLATHDALDHLTVLLQVPTTPGAPEHTLQLVAIRLFNSCASALKLGLSGYYQAAFQLLRDCLELVNLVDFFRIDSTALGRWQAADDKTLKRDFSPIKVRKALETHPDFAGQRRDRVYDMFSGFASHPSYKGFKLIAPGNSPKLGPFFDETMLHSLLADLGKHLSHAALGVSMHFDDVDVPIMHAKALYLASLRRYHENYIRAKPSASPAAPN